MHPKWLEDVEGETVGEHDGAGGALRKCSYACNVHLMRDSMDTCCQTSSVDLEDIITL